MNKEDIKSHKEVAEGMSWCDLASTIIDLEHEKAELEPYMTKREINKYNKLIKIYEDEKSKRVDRFNRNYKDHHWTELDSKLEYGINFVARWQIDNPLDLV